MIPTAEFIKIEKATTDNTMTTEIDKVHTNHNLQGGKLMSLDYLFSPYFWDDKGHWLILGTAPKQRFVFLLDCYHYPFKTNEHPLKSFLAFCLRALPESTDQSVYGEWSNRSQTLVEAQTILCNPISTIVVSLWSRMLSVWHLGTISCVINKRM
jgi:hypothetical protein